MPTSLAVAWLVCFLAVVTLVSTATVPCDMTVTKAEAAESGVSLEGEGNPRVAVFLLGQWGPLPEYRDTPKWLMQYVDCSLSSSIPEQRQAGCGGSCMDFAVGGKPWIMVHLSAQ